MAMGWILIPLGLFRVCRAVAFLVLLWASFLPFFAAPSWDAIQKLSFDNYIYLKSFRPFWDAMQNSIVLSILTASVAMLLTSLIAWIVYRSRLPDPGCSIFSRSCRLRFRASSWEWPDSSLRRFPDSDLRHHLGFADRLCHPLYTLWNAFIVGFNLADS